jgi:predicted N-acetyltransferase YhbS
MTCFKTGNLIGEAQASSIVSFFPVATDPQYRRMGLGRAAVLEGVRRCAALGARRAYVGSDQAFYQALGFRKVYDSQGCVKVFQASAEHGRKER